jgi:hypothetical protein
LLPEVNGGVTCRQFEELGVWFAELDIGEGEGLFADARVVELGEEIDAQAGGLPELAIDREGVIVADCAGIVGGRAAGAGGLDTFDLLASQIVVSLEASVVGERPAGSGRWAKGGHRRVGVGFDFAALRTAGEHAAVVPEVSGGLDDLDEIHDRFDVAVLGDEKPALLVDASLAVAGDAALIHKGDGPAVADRLLGPVNTTQAVATGANFSEF